MYYLSSIRHSFTFSLLTALIGKICCSGEDRGFRLNASAGQKRRSLCHAREEESAFCLVGSRLSALMHRLCIVDCHSIVPFGEKGCPLHYYYEKFRNYVTYIFLMDNICISCFGGLLDSECLFDLLVV